MTVYDLAADRAARVARAREAADAARFGPTEALLDVDPAWRVTPDEPETLTQGERARARQRALIAQGRHPLTRGPLHPDAAVDVPSGTRPPAPGTCGTCTLRRYRQAETARAYPKCHADDGARITNGEQSDVPAWWPACVDYIEAPR